MDNSFRLSVNFEQYRVYLGKIQIVIEIRPVKALPILSGESFSKARNYAFPSSGAVREVTSIMLSRTACTSVAINADQKKVMVKAAREYFAATITSEVMARSMESTVMLYKGARGKTQVPTRSGCRNKGCLNCSG